MARAGACLKFLLVATLFAAGAAWPEEGRGYFGVSVSVDGEGVFWNPVLKSVTVVKVESASPAAAAGIVAGDRIVEIEGKTIAGARTNEIEPLMKKKVGERLVLRVQRDGGEPRAVTLIAVVRP